MMNLETITAVLTNEPHVTVYTDLLQAAYDLYRGAIFADWEWMSDSDEVAFAVSGLQQRFSASFKA